MPWSIMARKGRGMEMEDHLGVRESRDDGNEMMIFHDSFCLPFFQ